MITDIRNLGTLYNYKKYTYPKLGKFRIDTNEYGCDGWIMALEERKIIGETDDCFVYQLKKSECGYWSEDGTRYIEKYILPLGIHKTRLEKWVCQQLELF